MMQTKISRRNFLQGAAAVTLAGLSPLPAEANRTNKTTDRTRVKHRKKIRLKSGRFTLVLSGGGALGIAHLGVLHDLEKRHIMPGEIVGTSMGGIVGACMAIGMREEEIYKKIKSLTGITNWIQFSFSGNAIIESDRLAKIFDGIFRNRKMKDTAIPLKLIATNLHTGHKKVFDRHDDVFIKDAVLATMSIPGIFEEKIINGKTYGDGYLCENLGINEASFHTLLAIDVMGENSFDGSLPDNFFKTTNILEMFERSIRILICNQTNMNLSCSKKRIYLIEPNTKHYKTYDFHKYKAIRTLGLNLWEH